MDGRETLTGNMLRFLNILLLTALVACQPVAQTTGSPRASIVPEPAIVSPPTIPAEKPTKPQGPVRSLQFVRVSLSGIPMEAVIFDGRTHRLIVADQPDGPGSKWADARTAGLNYGGLAALNGGFFNVDGSPLGQLVTRGRSVGHQNRSTSLGHGYFVEDAAGELQLVRRAEFHGGREALQTGPFLVENHRTITGLSDKSSTARSFLATDGQGGWLMVRTGACSLNSLAHALTGQSIGGVKIEIALNLDGGRSSDLWVSSRISGGPVKTRPIWNKPVRNFLILMSKS